MNQGHPVLEEPSESFEPLTQAQLSRLVQPGAPLTRRELRARERALANGQLKLIDGEYHLVPLTEPAEAPSAGGAGSAVVEEDGQVLPVTSADVLAGKVSSSTGMTRRQLRELAARHSAASETNGANDQNGSPQPADPEMQLTSEPATFDEGEGQPEPDAEPPRRVSARLVAAELDAEPSRGQLPAQQEPPESSARRPVVRPEGAMTTEHTGQLDPIHQAMRDINSAPMDANQVLQQRPVYQAVVPSELQETQATEEPTTAANDWSTAVTMPPVTDDVLANFSGLAIDEPTSETVGIDPEQTQAMAPVDADPIVEDDNDDVAMPDWHAVVSLPDTQDEPNAATDERTPKWLIGLQWLVIVVVATILGLLVWYAITTGFGERNTDALAEVLRNNPLPRNKV